MPTSRPSALSRLCEIILAVAPTSVLDVGVGFGKGGFLVREYTDVWQGRYDYRQWQTVLIGVEAFAPYVGDLQRHLYDDIIVDEALAALDLIPDARFDLALCCDVLEHHEEGAGLELLGELRRVAGLSLVTTPVVMSEQGAVNGNDYERHRHQYGYDVLSAYGAVERYDNTHLLVMRHDQPHAR